MNDSSSPEPSLQFDGVYQAVSDEAFDNLRFYPDGRVIVARTAPAAAEQLKPWFNREDSRYEHGVPFSLETGDLSFVHYYVAEAPIAYSGTIGEHELQLEVYAKHRNETQTRRYIFLPFDESVVDPDARQIGAGTEPDVPIIPLLPSMSDQELVAILQDRQKVTVPYFGDQPLELQIFEDIDQSELLPTLRSFLALGANDQHRDARHLLAYCKLTVEAVGPEVLEEMGNEMPTLETIGEFVKPKFLSFTAVDAGKYVSQRTVFATIEGNVEWEPEHGLQMSWADGNTLVKVGEFTGHPTNGMTTADLEQDRFVFACHDPELCTPRDE